MLATSRFQAAKPARAGDSQQPKASGSRAIRCAQRVSRSCASAMMGPSHKFGASIISRRREVGLCRAESPATTASLTDLEDSSFNDKHTFSSYANWLIPGQLLVGRYPFIDGKYCKTRIQGEDRLRTILESGATNFCTLQGELPNQVEIPIGGKDGFMPYKPVADMLASSMSGPVPEEWQVKLRNPWLDNYLPERKRPAPQQENKVEAVYKRFPVTDLETLSQEMLDEILEYLTEKLSSGEKVYMHGRGGRGRVGTVGACYLIKAYGLSAEEALKRVQLAYDTRRDGEHSSPETDVQRQFVMDFAARQQK